MKYLEFGIISIIIIIFIFYNKDKYDYQDMNSFYEVYCSAKKFKIALQELSDSTGELSPIYDLKYDSLERYTLHLITNNDDTAIIKFKTMPYVRSLCVHSLEIKTNADNQIYRISEYPDSNQAKQIIKVFEEEVLDSLKFKWGLCKLNIR